MNFPLEWLSFARENPKQSSVINQSETLSSLVLCTLRYLADPAVIYFHLMLMSTGYWFRYMVFQAASTSILHVLSIFSVLIIRQEKVQIKIAAGVVVISVATA